MKRTSELKALDLVNGHWGSQEGHLIARFLAEAGKMHIVVEFYDWVEKEGIPSPYLKDWLPKNYPDLYAVYRAIEKILS